MARNREQKRKAIFSECRDRLLLAREEVANKLSRRRGELSVSPAGDSADTAEQISRDEFEAMRNDQLLSLLRAINIALHRIEEGSYGICDETGLEIEDERLLAIPWTTLSIEGAESIELENKRRKKIAA